MMTTFCSLIEENFEWPGNKTNRLWACTKLKTKDQHSQNSLTHMDCVEVGILVLTFVQAQLFSALFSWKLRLPSPSVLAPTGWGGSDGEGGGCEGVRVVVRVLVVRDEGGDAQMLVCVLCMVNVWSSPPLSVLYKQ